MLVIDSFIKFLPLVLHFVNKMQCFLFAKNKATHFAYILFTKCSKMYAKCSKMYAKCSKMYAKCSAKCKQNVQQFIFSSL